MARPRSETPELGRRENGVYYAKWYDAEARRTKRKSLDTSDPGEAARRFGLFLLQGGEIYAGTPEQAGPSVSIVLDHYKAEHVDVKTLAKERAGYAIANLKAFFADTPLEDVDIPECRRYAAARRAGETGRRAIDSTIRRELGVLSAAANHALRWRRIEQRHMPAIELTPGTEYQDNKWLTREQVEALIAACAEERKDGHDAARERLRRFVVFAYWTGARRGVAEICRWDPQVDLTARRINLHPPGRKRTKKRNAIVRIEDALLEELVFWRAAEERGAVASPFVIGGSGGSVLQLFRRTARRAGLPAGVSPHWLRHSRITHLLQAGVSIYDVAKFAGDSVQTIERVYGHHCPDYQASTAQAA